MIHIKGFVDKIAYIEARSKRDVILTLEEARGLRDEITKLLASMQDNSKSQTNESIQVIMNGGKW